MKEEGRKWENQRGSDERETEVFQIMNWCKATTKVMVCLEGRSIERETSSIAAMMIKPLDPQKCPKK